MSMLLNNAQVDINTDEIFEAANNYTALNMAYLIEEQKEFNKNQIKRMITESMWMKACMEAGFILPIQEADETKVEPANNNTQTNKSSGTKKTSKISTTIKQWVNNFMTRIISDIAQRYESYGPWVEYYKDDLLAAVSKKDSNLSYKIVPYHQADYKTQSTYCVGSFNSAIKNMQSGNHTDYSYTNNIVDSKYVTGSSSEMNVYILNYFRTGKKNISDVNKVVLNGMELQKFVQTAINYISRYKTEVSGNVKKISAAYQKLDDVKMDTTESINPYMYLITEDKMLCESDLSSLINYNALLEDTPATSNQSNQDKKNDNTTATADGQTGSFTKVEKTDDKGQPVDKEQKKKNDTEKKETSGDKDAYIGAFKTYATSIITDYARVCDERIICYANVLIQIAQASNIPTPKKDENGNVDFKKRDEKKTEEKK